MKIFVYPVVDPIEWDERLYTMGVGKGTGFVTTKCKGDAWAPLPEEYNGRLRNAATMIGNVGYMLRATHTRFPMVRDARYPGRMHPGPMETFVCLERVSDGEFFDVKFEDFYRCWEKNPLNAMEVLARVKEVCELEVPTKEAGAG